MNFFGNPHLRQVRQSLRDGDLQSACRVALSSGCLQSAGGSRIARRLVAQLVQRAARSAASGNLNAAWDDLSSASRLQAADCLDELARHQNELVETTIDAAAASLQRGQPATAARTLQLLGSRKIADRRANEMESLCRLVREAETLSAAGRWKEAGELLEEAQRLRPDLEFIQSRIRVTRKGRETVSELTHQLRRAITRSHWEDAEELSNQILRIAPNHQIALDAHRHCRAQHQDATQTSGTPELLIIGHSSEGQRAARDSAAISRDDTTPGESRPVPNRPTGDRLPNQPSDTGQFMRSFMLWVDGVGGYLVCTSPQVTIGRAVERAEVDIPLQADIRRRHLRIKRTGTSYVAQPLDDVDLDQQTIHESTILRDGQVIQLAGGVETRFTLPHPLGCSARLEFTSRHRTEPWSDAVLLLGDAILIGRSESHHIVAADIQDELMVFRKGDDIVLRCPGKFEINDQTGSGDVILHDGLRVQGDGFSISVEQIGRTGADTAK